MQLSLAGAEHRGANQTREALIENLCSSRDFLVQNQCFFQIPLDVFWTTHPALESMFAHGCKLNLFKRLYDEDQNLEQSGIPVQGGRGSGQFRKPHRGGRPFFEQALPQNACIPGCPKKKGLHSSGGVSLYAPRSLSFSQNSRRELVQNTLDEISPKGEGSIVVQPSKRQWQNLAKVLDRRFPFRGPPTERNLCGLGCPHKNK